MHKIGDIVLTPFPFTDLSGNKVRPALILGLQTKGEDITVCFISSVNNKNINSGDVLINEKEKSFKDTGLKTTSTIKVNKIATLDKIVILGKIGELDLNNLKKVKSSLKNHFKL